MYPVEGYLIWGSESMIKRAAELRAFQFRPSQLADVRARNAFDIAHHQDLGQFVDGESDGQRGPDEVNAV